MAILPQPLLFSWQEIEELDDLSRLKLALETLPDEPLMQVLEAERGQGRDDYPVRAMWNSLVAGIVFQHGSIESLRRELRRNGQLRLVCGFDPTRGDRQVPPSWAYSRFLSKLLAHQGLVDEIFEHLIWQVSAELPDFGKHLAIDGKAIRSFAHKRSARTDGDRRGEHDADWGVKTYSCVRSDGSTERRTDPWFGFKAHTIVDTTYELPVDFRVTRASVSEQPVALELFEELEDRRPYILDRAETCAADRGYDATAFYTRLWDRYEIKPVIGIRDLWKQPEGMDGTRPVRGLRNVAYDGRGRVYCYDAFGLRHKMAYGGFEKDRDTLKYRCPARHYGLRCAGQNQCPLGASMRIPLQEDRRVFTPIARDSYVWKDRYKERTAVERVYSRLDTSFGFEQHTTRGREKMHLKLSLAYSVMLAMGLGHVREGRAENMRSLVKTG